VHRQLGLGALICEAGQAQHDSHNGVLVVVAVFTAVRERAAVAERGSGASPALPRRCRGVARNFLRENAFFPEEREAARRGSSNAPLLPGCEFTLVG
jgi:hypothetical protein